jgi:hypothetical protein
MSSSAIVTNTTTNRADKKPILQFEGSAIKTKKIERIDIPYKTTNLASNVLISFGQADYSHPQITRDGSNNIVVAFTEVFDIFDHRLAWSYSIDNGEIWEGVTWVEEAYDEYNDVAWVDFDYYTGLFGTYNDISDGYESFYEMPDVTDLDSWNFYYWTNGAEDLTYNVISDNGYLEGQYHDMDGPVYFNI